MEPTKDLLGAIGRLAELSEEHLELGQRKLPQIGLGCFGHCQPWISEAAKKKAISCLAVSGPSEPWTALFSMLAP